MRGFVGRVEGDGRICRIRRPLLPFVALDLDRVFFALAWHIIVYPQLGQQSKRSKLNSTEA